MIDKVVEALKRKDIVKPTLILLALFILQQLSGAYVIIFYAVSLFQKVGGRFEDYDYINEYGALLLLGLIRFIMSILASGWVKALKSSCLLRKPLNASFNRLSVSPPVFHGATAEDL